MATRKADLKHSHGHPSSRMARGSIPGQPLEAIPSVEYSTLSTTLPHSPIGPPVGFAQSHTHPLARSYDGTVAPYDGIMSAAQDPEGSAVSPYIQIQPQRSGPPKEVSTAYKMAIGGIFGLHHFYLERPKFGVLYLFTGGLLVVGWLFDLCRMPFLVKQANEMIDNPEKFQNKRTMLDAYVLWFPLGFFGAHHYYLGRMHWGVAYTFSLGLLGIGWAIDGVRMKQLVKEANETLAQNPPRNQIQDPDEKKLSECYILAVTPLGLLGAHYYYLERWMFAVMYTFTVGLFGIGWLVDLCTLKVVFERANKIRRREVDPNHRYLSEAYKLIFPLGFLGLHHFYLRRPGWGVLYFFTFGCVAIGWIVDFFRLPSLVKEANAAAEREAANLTELQDRLSGQPPPPPELPQMPPPPQYSPRPMSRRHHPEMDARMEQTSGPGSNTNHWDAPPPYTPRAPPSYPKAPVSHARPVTSAMDVITEEDEDAISVISGTSRTTASQNDVALENSLNDSIDQAGGNTTSSPHTTAF